MVQHAARQAAMMVVLAGVLGCTPVQRVRARLELKNGNQSYLQRDYAAAIAHYDAALRFVPSLATAQLNRAYSHVLLLRSAANPEDRRRLATEAVHSFQAYLAAAGHAAKAGDSDRTRVEQQIVTLYIDSGQADEAVQYLTAKLTDDPADAATLQMLATIEAERGHLDEALGWHRKHIVAAPHSPEAHYALGAFIWQRSYRNPVMDATQRTPLLNEGLAVLQRALEMRPEYFDALVYVNLLYREMAKYAATETERAAFMTQAKMWYDRATAVRKATTGAPAPADSVAASGAVPGVHLTTGSR